MEKVNVVTSSKFAIVNMVATTLNLGDYGKIEGFVERTAKFLKREIETRERVMKNDKHNHDSALLQLNDDLEDAQQAVEDAYTSLDPKKLKNNDMQKDFRETYLSAIDSAEGVVKGIEEDIKKAKDAFKEKNDKNKEQNKIREIRIARLTKGVTEVSK